MKETLSLIFLMNPSPIRTFYKNREKKDRIVAGTEHRTYK